MVLETTDRSDSMVRVSILLYSMVHHLTSGVESVMGLNCTLVLETARLVYQVAKSPLTS